jgi:hypothetical protein
MPKLMPGVVPPMEEPPAPDVPGVDPMVPPTPAVPPLALPPVPLPGAARRVCPSPAEHDTAAAAISNSETRFIRRTQLIISPLQAKMICTASADALSLSHQDPVTWTTVLLELV